MRLRRGCRYGYCKAKHTAPRADVGEGGQSVRRESSCHHYQSRRCRRKFPIGKWSRRCRTRDGPRYRRASDVAKESASSAANGVDDRHTDALEETSISGCDGHYSSLIPKLRRYRAAASSDSRPTVIQPAATCQQEERKTTRLGRPTRWRWWDVGGWCGTAARASSADDDPPTPQ